MEENQYKDMNFIERLQYFMEKKGINDNQMTVNAGLSVGLIGKAKVIIAQATAETAEALYGLVKKMVDTTAIKAYPSVDYQAVFFSADRYDLDFVKRVLADKCFSFKIEDAE